MCGASKMSLPIDLRKQAITRYNRLHQAIYLTSAGNRSDVLRNVNLNKKPVHQAFFGIDMGEDDLVVAGLGRGIFGMDGEFFAPGQ